MDIGRNHIAFGVSLKPVPRYIIFIYIIFILYYIIILYYIYYIIIGYIYYT